MQLALNGTITWNTSCSPMQASLSRREGKGGPSTPLGTPWNSHPGYVPTFTLRSVALLTRGLAIAALAFMP